MYFNKENDDFSLSLHVRVGTEIHTVDLCIGTERNEISENKVWYKLAFPIPDFSVFRWYENRHMKIKSLLDALYINDDKRQF